jgi:hypothetical protein
MKTWSEPLNLSDSHMEIFITLHLAGEPLKQFQKFFANTKSIKAAIKKLAKIYKTSHTLEDNSTLLEQLELCQLNDNESLDSFSNRFRLAFFNLFPESREEDLIKAFTRRLPLRLSKHIQNLNFSSLDEAIFTFY